MMKPGQRRYPRPQLERARWQSLDGRWDFALDVEGRWHLPEQVSWNAKIEVPFAPETPAGGVGFTDFFRACWYRRVVTPGPISSGERVLLHFGAVDYRAQVWVGDSLLGGHEGGYTPFSFDATKAFRGGPQTIVVRAEDDPVDLAKLRGKQDWQREPHSIWYPRTTGIWQTVWLEVVPKARIGSVRWASSLDRWELSCDLSIEGDVPPGSSLQLRLGAGGKLIANDRYEVLSGEVNRRIALSDPGLDDRETSYFGAPSLQP